MPSSSRASRPPCRDDHRDHVGCLSARHAFGDRNPASGEQLQLLVCGRRVAPACIALDERGGVRELGGDEAIRRPDGARDVGGPDQASAGRPGVAVGMLFQRFLIMAGFIEQHFDHLAGLEFLRSEGDRLWLTGSLFSTLNNLPMTPSEHGGVEPFDVDTVIAGALAHRERLGDGVIVPRSGSHRSPWMIEGAVGRNDLCPCASGRKFKRCCWSRMN